MMEQRGSFAGVDTCNHVEFGRFDRDSILRFDVEMREIYNRFDIYAHLNVLCKNKIISEVHAKDIRKDAENVYANKDFTKLYMGGTYVPMEVAMSYQRENKERTISIRIPGGINDVVVKVERYWPYYIYPCQKVSNFGCQVLTITNVADRGGICFRKLWKVVCLFTQVQKIWQLCSDATISSNDWYGWFLVYLTKHCTSVNRRQSRKDPFKQVQVYKAKDLWRNYLKEINQLQIYSMILKEFMLSM